MPAGGPFSLDKTCGDGSFDVEGKIGKGRNVWKLRALRPMVVI